MMSALVRTPLLALAVVGLSVVTGAAALAADVPAGATTTAGLQAQGTITGVVRRADANVLLERAQVSILGTRNEALTDGSGQYRLAGVPAGQHTIQVRLLGYAPVEQRVTVGQGQAVTLDFELVPRAVYLDEVVVSVDVARTRRIELGTDLATLNIAEDLESAVPKSMSELLAGRTAGVDIRQSTGPVGTASPIRVRGVTSLTQAKNPLIIMDGVRVSNNTGSGPQSIDWTEGRTVSRIDDINPNDLASVQVIKGPTATALYGSEAASGVIIIETKRGAAGQAQFQASTEIGGVEDPGKYYDKWFNFTQHMGITDPNDPVARQWFAVPNDVTGDVWGLNNPMTNPLTNPRRVGLSVKSNVSVQGGTDVAQYFVSGLYEDTDGPYANNTVDRWGFRANVDGRALGTLDISASAAYTEVDLRFPESTRSFRGFATNGGAGNPVTSFGVRPDGTRGDCLATLFRGQNPSICEFQQGNLVNNFDDLLTVFSGQETGRFVGSATVQWAPFRWLSQQATLGIDRAQEKDINFFPLDPARPFGVLSAGFIRDVRNTVLNRTYEYAATVSANLSSTLRSTTTVGAQYFKNARESVGCTGEGGFASPTATACDASLDRTGFSSTSENVQIGAYGQQRFGYKDYIFATVGVRIDDNSSFGQNIDAIWSPALNASAVLSDMPFWKWEVVNSLRLRGAWGRAIQAPPPFAALRRLTPVRLDAGGSPVAGVTLAFPGNPDLTAEKKTEMELGIDAELWDSRLAIKFTYYDQQTADAILERFVAPSIGFPGQQWVNVGKVENSGIELGVSGTILDRRNLNWSMNYTLSTQNPMVTDMGEIGPVFLGGNGRGMFAEGYAPGAYYGPIIESAERDANGLIVPGSVVFKDCPELPQDWCPLGDPQPGHIHNLSTRLNFFEGRLRLYTLFDARGDMMKADQTNSLNLILNRTQGAPTEYAFREVRLTPQQQAALERQVAGDGDAAFFLWVQDGSFIKWRELSLGYDLPRRWVNAIRGSRASLTLGVRNIRTFTKYRGNDPEAWVRGGDTSFVGNEEFYSEHTPRIWFGRFDITF